MSKELDELNKAIWESMSKEQRMKQTFHLMALRASIAAEAITIASRSRLDEWDDGADNRNAGRQRENFDDDRYPLDLNDESF